MTLSLSIVSLIIAFILFVASAIPKTPPWTWNLFNLGWAFVVLAWLLSGYPVRV